MDCGVRGPFLPTYWHDVAHWSKVYLDMIDRRKGQDGGRIDRLDETDYCVKLDPGCYGPKVEGYLWATDRMGLGSVLDYGPHKVFANHPTKVDAILHGMNRAIYQANYSIATPLLASVASTGATGHGSMQRRATSSSTRRVRAATMACQRTRWRPSSSRPAGRGCLASVRRRWMHTQAGHYVATVSGGRYPPRNRTTEHRSTARRSPAEAE